MRLQRDTTEPFNPPMEVTMTPRAPFKRFSLAPLAAMLVAAGACTGNIADPPGGSGGGANTCSDDLDCPTGFHCGDNALCTAECSSDSDCGLGMSCDDRGYCSTGIGAGGKGGGGGGPGCADIDIGFNPVVPTVVLLIDQSGSMTSSYPGGNRWDVLYDALMDPQDGVVKSLESQVRFGLALYTSQDGSQGGTCPILTEVSIALDNHAAIEAIYASNNPEDETPTGESVEAVATQLANIEETGPKIIILATDGEPDTCAEPNPQNGQAVAIAAAEAAYANGIETVVLAVGNQISQGHLQDMANAGAGLPVNGSQNATYYQPNDKQGLIDDFNTIIDGQRSCVLTLNGVIDPDRACDGEVYLDGNPLECDGPDGWRANGGAEIELLGAACDTIKTGDHSVTGSFPCGAVVEPPR